MSLITYNQSASMDVKGIVPLAGAGISLLASPSFQVAGASAGDYLAETYQVEPSTSTTALDLGKIVTGRTIWIQTDQPLEVTCIQASFFGTSVSADSPATSTAAGTLTLNINGDGAQIITLGTNSTGAAVAADIQAKVRALTAFTPANQGAYDNFVASFSGTYTLKSGIGGSGSSVVVTGASDAITLKLGVAHSGVETAGVPAAVIALDSFLMANITFSEIQLANTSATAVANVAIVILGDRASPSGSGIF